ncbi:glycosyltransferase [Roseobacter sp. A03A-229]
MTSDQKAWAMGELSWGLVVSTKDRLDALTVCVELALAQTRPPSEVVVVDASADWQDHARIIKEACAVIPGLPVTYLQADQPSLTVQRNQGVAVARADILFMIDDDSFMHPDCAEKIMALYEKDTETAVAGIQAAPTSEVPPQVQRGGAPQAGARKDVGALNFRQKAKSGHHPVRQWIMRKLFLMNAEEMFIPYDGAFHRHPLPATLQGEAVTSAILFVGFRMTFRRDAVQTEPFDGLLRYYCPGEDADVSYRISRHRAILSAREARLHHFTSASGRINRRATTVLSSLNQAVLLHRHAADRTAARRRYFALMRRRLLAETFKDLLSRRLRLPQARGVLQAWASARAIFEMSPEDLVAWYPGAQERVVKGQSPGRGS